MQFRTANIAAEMHSTRKAEIIPSKVAAHSSEGRAWSRIELRRPAEIESDIKSELEIYDWSNCFVVIC